MNNDERVKFYTRQATLMPATAQKPALIIGCGGIGSMVGLVLAKLGTPHITLFDDDTIEEHNLPSQFFTQDQLGMYKAQALTANLVEHGVGLQTTHQTAKWDNETVAPVVICAVDSMKTRKEIWEVMQRKVSVELYIETRMSAENMRIYAFRPSDPDFKAKYEASLYSDEEADPAACTSRAIAYNTFVIAGIVGSLVKKYTMGEPVPFEFIFDLKNYGLYRTPTE